MQALGSLETHADRAAEAVARRVAGIYEGLEQLAAITVALAQSVDPTDAELDAFREELTIDEAGYLARREVLEAAMRGDIDPDQTTFYVHERFAEDRDVLRAMFRIRKLGPRIRRLKSRLGGIEWIYFQHPAGWAMSYPMHDPHSGIAADFDWLSYFTFQSVEPSVNPERQIRWTPPNIDYAGKGLMVSPSIPVYLDDDTFAGVWSMDVPAAHLLEDVRGTYEAPGLDTFIVDREGLLVAHRKIATVIEEKGSFSRESIQALGGDFRDLEMPELMTQASGVRELKSEDGVELACAHATIEDLGWAVVMTCPSADLFETLRRSFQHAFDRLSHGDVGHRMENLGGEGQFLVDAYNDMAAALERTLAKQQREQQVQQRNQRLQAIGQLAGGIAHDFNNLLTAMLISASMLRVDGDDAELVEDIRIAGERAAAMTAQLLAFSRDSVARPELLDLARVVRDLERLLRRLVPEGIELVVEADAEDARVLADPHQVLQIVLNLVINARDALATDGTIRIELTSSGEWVTLCVFDDGVGIPADVRDRVFEPFFTTKSTGTGLGLSTVKQIVDVLGGDVELESVPDKGTRVQLRLPVAAGQPDARGSGPMEQALHGLRVLVVDDDALVLRTTVRALEGLGCTVTPHTIAPDAADALQTGDWDVLLTDVVMPAMSGWEIARRAREARPDLRVLFMSGYTPDTLQMHGMESAEHPLLRKPFTRQQLGEALSEVMAAAKS